MQPTSSSLVPPSVVCFRHVFVFRPVLSRLDKLLNFVPTQDFGYVGAGLCYDEKSRPYNAIVLQDTSKYDCPGTCAEFLDGLVGYHYDEYFESCFCNVGYGVRLGTTGFGKCPTGLQCTTGNGGFGPVFSSSGDERVYCYKVLS